MYAYLISSSLLKRLYGNYTEYEIVSFDKDVRFHIKQTVTFSKIELNGVIVDKYTGIFANGIGVKSDSDNYFFVNHTSDNGLTISAKSKGKGFTLSNGTWTWEGGINP